MSTQTQNGPLADQTAFRRDLLRTAVALEGREKLHGLAIKARLEAEYGYEINHGRLYPNLDDLVEAGLLQKHEWDKRTNEYRPTRRGRRELEAHAEWVSEVLSK